MSDAGRSSKTKLMMLLLFGMLTVVFIASVVRLFQDISFEISRKNDEVKCRSLNYRLDNVQYSNNNLNFNIVVISGNISKMSLITKEGETREYVLNSDISGGQTRTALFNNVSLTGNVAVYPNECATSKKELVIS